MLRQAIKYASFHMNRTMSHDHSQAEKYDLALCPGVGREGFLSQQSLAYSFRIYFFETCCAHLLCTFSAFVYEECFQKSLF